ncbi:hypothetical protein GE115_09770 [Agromyces sp. CFH 90414]|uniref:DUF2975 domain-containing protein n=1 Tax=Agromyces agglutinans TaxID=2662258 RepID=A0A6I2F7B7_9MICO|nr:hypothetical protein [Agromyces agglutinans]MRG60154.1 hypothetical protein [Agromyces agglutinans]
MSLTSATTRLSAGDRVGMYLTVVLAAIGVAVTAWAVGARLVEVLPGTDVPVLVPFVGEQATLPIGPDGAPVEVDVDRAVVTVPQPAAATQFALVAQPIVTGAATIAAIAMLALFAWNVARGRAFARANVRIVIAATFTLLAGWVFGSLFTTMGVNGALSAVSEYTYDGVLFSTDWTAFWGILALGALGAAFQIGERLQRETEGLV